MFILPTFNMKEQETRLTLQELDDDDDDDIIYNKPTRCNSGSIVY